jgi:hypothetical protein
LFRFALVAFLGLRSCSRRMAAFGGGTGGRRRPSGVFGLALLMLVLPWSEQMGCSAGTVLFNKSAVDRSRESGHHDLQAPLAGRGGEGGTLQFLARSAAEALLAGRGGEEESGSSGSTSTPRFRSRLVGGAMLRCGRVQSFSSLYHCGCEVGGGDGVHPHCSWRRLMHKGICNIELNHAVGFITTAILCRQIGNLSTSKTEASFCASFWSSTLHCHQVVRPRWLRGGQRWWCIAGRGYSSFLVLFLGGDAWRTPATCGRGTSGLDCFFIFSPRVWFVKVQALSSNFLVLRARVVKGSSCNLYLPCL